ncbi:MAG: Cna B-type domain-containing protein, partial [Clostridiales bacterium]|nr:Cna B-type domain-containing protein [Clostridiales bacterium]
LSLNIGANSRGNSILHSVLYVLTNDGYIYQTDFNGIDPYGFVFFANNRGLINAETNSSLLASGVSTTNDMLSIKSNGKDVQFHSPIHPDTLLDHTHKIFFEMPANDLPSYIKPTPQIPGTITDFRFTGYEDNVGYVGGGGYFYFNADKASSFEIKLDFTNYVNELGQIENRGMVFLGNTCVQGLNKIYWDGRDANGNILPAGYYGGNNDVQMTVVAKAGVYHFPMLDVENNRNGIKIRLMNTPVDRVGNPVAISEEERCKVYYNNSFMPSMTQADSGAPLNQLNGYDSRLGASKFGVTATNNPGDFGAIDVWASYSGQDEIPVVIPPNFQLIEPPDNILSLRGLAFYDENNDGLYKMVNGDYAMANVQVDLYKDGVKIASDTTDITGMYHFGGLPYGTYQVRVTAPRPNITCSTNNLNQNVIVSTAYATNGVVRANDVGFYYQLYPSFITVIKDWDNDIIDPIQPNNIKINVLAKRGSDTENIYSVILSPANGWQHTFSDLPRYAANGSTLLTYEVVEEPVPGYYQKSMDKVTTPGYETYTFINAPRGIISVTKVDFDDNDKKLEGAVFEFWRRGTPNTLIATKTTDVNGKAFVSDLAAGTYFVKEISAPNGYYFDTASAQSADFAITLNTTDYHKQLLFTNKEALCNFVLEKKILSASDSNEQFMFEITGPNGVLYAAITIPAGSTSSSVSFVDMPAGTYSIKQISNSNWRYELIENQTEATNGTITYSYAAGKLQMPVNNPTNNDYKFLFVSERTKENWLSDHESVTNKMSKP